MVVYVLFACLVFYDTSKCGGYIASTEIWQDDYERKVYNKG